MIPEARLLILQIFHVKEELILRLLLIILSVKDASHIGKEQNRHEQGIIPDFSFIPVIRGLMLNASLLSSRHLRHNPFRCLAAGLHVLLAL